MHSWAKDETPGRHPAVGFARFSSQRARAAGLQVPCHSVTNSPCASLWDASTRR